MIDREIKAIGQAEQDRLRYQVKHYATVLQGCVIDGEGNFFWVSTKWLGHWSERETNVYETMAFEMNEKTGEIGKIEDQRRSSSERGALADHEAVRERILWGE